MTLLATVSYFTPVLSAVFAALVLHTSLTANFGRAWRWLPSAR